MFNLEKALIFGLFFSTHRFCHFKDGIVWWSHGIQVSEIRNAQRTSAFLSGLKTCQVQSIQLFANIPKWEIPHQTPNHRNFRIWQHFWLWSSVKKSVCSIVDSRHMIMRWFLLQAVPKTFRLWSVLAQKNITCDLFVCLSDTHTYRCKYYT